MEIINNYLNKEEWDKFVAVNSEPASFLQSYGWGEFNEKILGHRVLRWLVVENKKPAMALSIIRKKLARAMYYYYCPRGPVWQKSEGEKRFAAYKLLIKKVKGDLGEAVFARVSPPYEFKDYLSGFIKRLGLVKPKILVHGKEPGKTLILDLLKSEDDLLSDMRPKTRYNIRLAERKGIKVKLINEATKKKGIEIFNQLTEITARRDKIKIYDKAYYRELINFFCEHNKNLNLKLYLAEYNGQPLSAAIVVYFGKTATYLHGASADTHRELMPNHSLQWAIIKEAKAAGMAVYDFWGVSEHRPNWAGLTRFKRGFGGREISYLGTWDFVLNKKWYNLLRLLKILKKICLR